MSDLEPGFQESLSNFLAALKAADATVRIAATYRPPERAWLMHWSYMLSCKKVKANEIPAKNGINIQWDHGDEEKSVAAAKAMADAFEISHLGTPPAKVSRHTQKKAVDMSITWRGTLEISDADGNAVKIDTEPKTGMNAELHEVGKSFGVIKFWKGAKDKPHWSTDGR